MSTTKRKMATMTTKALDDGRPSIGDKLIEESQLTATKMALDDDRPSIGDKLIEEAQQKASKILLTSSPSLDENPMLGDQYKNDGNKKFGNKQWDGAYEDYSQAIDLNYKDATYYSNRSACLIQLDRPEEALEDAVFARTLRPDWSKACYRTAVALLAIAEQQQNGSTTTTTDDDDNCNTDHDVDVGDIDDSLFETAAMVAWDGLLLDPKNNDLKVLLRKCAKLGRQAYRRRRKRSSNR